jgi:hypothetical protein
VERYREEDLLDACRMLFGPHIGVNGQFLHYIQADGLRRAYRARAREYHPDVARTTTDQARRTELFRKSVAAYELLAGYLQARKPVPTREQAPRRAPVRPKAPVERYPNERFYRGPFPTLELKIGLFLYYKGEISYQALVRALLWQRNQRPRVGELACKWGWLEEDAIPFILQATCLTGCFGARAVKLGYLTEQQLRVLLFHQRSLHQPIGRYFVMNGILTEDKLRRMLRECAQHNKNARHQTS